MKVAVKRPAPFFKGIILPLVESKTVTKLEAEIFSNIFLHTKVPMLHAAACMLKIAEVSPYLPAYTIFIRAFILKHYNLPFQVLDALVYHFYNFITADDSEILVIWHQALLDFCDKYGQLISNEQKQLLLALIKKRKHPKYSPMIRKILEQESVEEHGGVENVSEEVDNEGEFNIDGSNDEEFSMDQVDEEQEDGIDCEED